ASADRRRRLQLQELRPEPQGGRTPRSVFGSARSADATLLQYAVYGLGTGRETFADLVDTGYLPQARARVCRVKFGEVNFAFQQTLQRHVDRDMAKSGNCYGWICRSPPSSVAPDGRRIRSRSELGGTGGDPDHRVV